MLRLKFSWDLTSEVETTEENKSHSLKEKFSVKQDWSCTSNHHHSIPRNFHINNQFLSLGVYMFARTSRASSQSHTIRHAVIRSQVLPKTILPDYPWNWNWKRLPADISNARLTFFMLCDNGRALQCIFLHYPSRLPCEFSCKLSPSSRISKSYYQMRCKNREYASQRKACMSERATYPRD